MTKHDTIRRRGLAIALCGAVVAVTVWISREAGRSELSDPPATSPLPSERIVTSASQANSLPAPELALPDRTPESIADREQQLRERARTWSRADLPAAAAWLLTLSDADAAIVADAMLAEVGRDDAAGALALALELRRGVDDGQAEHRAQIWTEEDPIAAVAWITALPPGADRDRLLARASLVRVQHDSAEAARLLDAIADGPARDAAVAAAIARLKIYDPDKAEKWQAILARN